MRAYFFTNFYLNTISQGIQPAHCIVDMLMWYNREVPTDSATVVLNQWPTDHKTMICLNGGMLADIEEKYQMLAELGNMLGLPYGHFCEEQAALGGQMTTCGIIVPEHIYVTAAKRWFDNDTKFTDTDGTVVELASVLNQNEIRLAALIRSCPLAR